MEIGEKPKINLLNILAQYVNGRIGFLGFFFLWVKLSLFDEQKLSFWLKYSFCAFVKKCVDIF
jgi:hypothetical protein